MMDGVDDPTLASVLALCARIDGHAALAGRLICAAATIDWDALPDHAEAHGLTPLVSTHLQAAGISSGTSTGTPSMP